MNCKLIDAKEEFFEALKGKRDAEEKRKAFREKFYRKLGEIVNSEGARFLVQGTIAADVEETVSGIKTQHNVLEQIGIDPKKYGFELIEPLKDLYKPEVREIARELKLPKEISERMPFPGPALSIRCLGDVTPERIEILRKATKIVEEETKDVNSFQSFAILLSDKATGIKDGRRVYGDIIVVRTVSSTNAITAEAVKLPHDLLNRISKRLTAELPTVVRCLYDVTDKPPSCIEFE
jgi:GMP synthase (glutamine-hydrolysing)